MGVPSAKYAVNRADFRGQLVEADQLALGDADQTKTATAATGAATLDMPSGVVTTESLTTAAGAVYTLTLTNTCIAAKDIVLVSVGNGTNSAGSPALTTVTTAAGSVVIKVQNIHASAALNGTLTIAFAVIKV